MSPTGRTHVLGPPRQPGRPSPMNPVLSRCSMLSPLFVALFVQKAQAQTVEPRPPPPPAAMPEPPPPPPPAPPPEAMPAPPPLAGWHGGLFYLRDPNDNFRLYFQGRAQIDWYSYFGPGVPD